MFIITRYFHEMASQLRGLGYEGEIVEVVEFQSFQAFSTEQEIFQKKCERVREGVLTLGKMKEQFSSDFLVLCPYRALDEIFDVVGGVQILGGEPMD